MPKTHQGRHIIVHEPDAMGFEHVSAMLLEFFDVPERDGAAFILGDYIIHPTVHFRELYPGRRLIVYQLEQMVGSQTWHPLDRTIANLAGADEIWDYDSFNVAFLERFGVRVDRLVPMLYTPSLRRIELRDEPSIDVLFTGFMNERRHRIFLQIQRQTYGRLRLMWLQGVSGEDLDRHIADAKIVLNLHAFEPWHRQEQTRIFYPLINGRMVVGEASERNWYGSRIVEVDPDLLPETLAHWSQGDRWRHFGLRAAERYRQGTAVWFEDAGMPDAADRVRRSPGHLFDAEAAAATDPSPDDTEQELLDLVRDLRVHDPGCGFVRLGGPNDGGYVIPRILLESASRLISVGVGEDSRFEEDWFALTGKPVETYDGQWPCHDICRRWPDEVGNRIRHTVQNVGDAEGMTPLRRIVEDREGAVLKIDAEGAEYGLVPGCDLSRLDGIVLECHELERAERRAELRGMLRHLDRDFVLVHLHGNNFSGVVPLPGALQEDGDGLPACLELTFLSRRLASPKALRQGPFPTPGLDRCNTSRIPLVPPDYQLRWVNRI